jgi:Tfp pilus assembly pilus retraction ATPase PilT
VNVIREGRTELLAHEIATGKRTGMVMMDDSLAKLVEEKRVLAATACDHAFDRAALEKKLGIAPGTPKGASGESP